MISTGRSWSPGPSFGTGDSKSVGGSDGMRHSGSMATTRSAVWPERRAMAPKNAARRYDTIRESLQVQPLMRQAPRMRVSVASTISMVSGACIVVLLSSDRLPEVRSAGEAHVRSSRPRCHQGQHGPAVRKLGLSPVDVAEIVGVVAHHG